MVYKQRKHCTYLGVKLVKNGNLRFAVKALNEQALSAFITLLFVCKMFLSTYETIAFCNQH